MNSWDRYAEFLKDNHGSSRFKYFSYLPDFVMTISVPLLWNCTHSSLASRWTTGSSSGVSPRSLVSTERCAGEAASLSARRIELWRVFAICCFPYPTGKNCDCCPSIELIVKSVELAGIKWYAILSTYIHSIPTTPPWNLQHSLLMWNHASFSVSEVVGYCLSKWISRFWMSHSFMLSCLCPVERKAQLQRQ